jgi:hypothetical protein
VRACVVVHVHVCLRRVETSQVKCRHALAEDRDLDELKRLAVVHQLGRRFISRRPCSLDRSVQLLLLCLPCLLKRDLFSKDEEVWLVRCQCQHDQVGVETVNAVPACESKRAHDE